MSGYQYIPKVGQVHVTTLPSNGAWTPILTEAQAKACRGIKVKSRFTVGQSTLKPFDIAFSDSPDETGNVSNGTGFISNTGSGFGDTFSPVSGVFARTTTSGVVIEVLVYQ